MLVLYSVLHALVTLKLSFFALIWLQTWQVYLCDPVLLIFF